MGALILSQQITQAPATFIQTVGSKNNSHCSEKARGRRTEEPEMSKEEKGLSKGFPCVCVYMIACVRHRWVPLGVITY